MSAFQRGSYVAPPIFRVTPGPGLTRVEPWPSAETPLVNLVWRTGRRHGWYPDKPRGWRP